MKTEFQITREKTKRAAWFLGGLIKACEALEKTVTPSEGYALASALVKVEHEKARAAFIAELLGDASASGHDISKGVAVNAEFRRDGAFCLIETDDPADAEP